MKKLILSIFVFEVLSASAQFAPPAGQTGTSAMHKDSSAFVNWASACQVIRGYKDISVPDSGFASVGDSSMALGLCGSNGIVSLGDGGSAIVQFPYPVQNLAGPDFAVFENSFSDDFLELAFVEVSSDGINFFRFPATSNTQDSSAIGSFGLLDATKINNLAGKYRMFYGTPFDLNELSGTPGLDLSAITHIKITDVVGSIDPAFASTDINGNKINDPWPTPFPSSGFDLDAVGVIHQNTTIGTAEFLQENEFSCYQATEHSLLVYLKQAPATSYSFSLFDLSGRLLLKQNLRSGNNEVELNNRFSDGVYICTVQNESGQTFTKKILIR